MVVDDNLWLISDTHWGHANIVRLAERPPDHETLMLERWAEQVGEDEPVLHLGDLFWKRPQDWVHVLNKLPGQKYMLRGNHDNATNANYAAAGFTVIEPFACQRLAFTHRPITDTFPFPDKRAVWHTNIHGHIHNNDHRAAEGVMVPGKRYVNVSVEVIDYKPVRLGTLLDELAAEDAEG